MTRKYFFTSDTHFSHKNVIKYCNRPFNNADEMNEVMIANWNKTVGKQDIVYHLGDVMFEKDPDKRHWILSRLNGEKHLIFGNHDKGLEWKKHFQTGRDIAVVHVPYKGETKRFVLCHYAMKTWDKAHYGTIHLYGHSHGTMADDPHSLSCDVGVDCWNYTPVSLEQILEVMSRKTFVPLDHHE